MHAEAEHSGPAAGWTEVVRRLATITVCAVLPALTLVTMFAVGLSDDSLSADFHHEIYPQAEEMLAGRNPYPAPDFDPTVSPNFIWPPIVAFLHAPLTVLPIGAADLVMVVVGLVLFALALWIVGVRDWRVYGAVALWPQVAGEMRVSHLTPALCVLAALAWRYRDERLIPGVAVGAAVALKFFAWPLTVWLAPRRRYSAALVAVSIAGASLLLVLPFTSLDDYVRALLQLGRGFDQDAYTLFGLVVQSGGSESLARVATFAAGALLLAATWRYRSFTLALAAALALSPIVWLDYFALAAVPLALARPRLSAAWFLPIATWGMSGAGVGTGDASEIARLLVVFGIVFAIAFRGEPDRLRAAAPVAA
jgi:Glycosyltransferase family 87